MAVCGNNALAKNGEPIAFWQSRQWQTRTLIGSPSAFRRTAPHRHLPSLTMIPPTFDLRRAASDPDLRDLPAFDPARQVPVELVSVQVDCIIELAVKCAVPRSYSRFNRRAPGPA